MGLIKGTNIEDIEKYGYYLLARRDYTVKKFRMKLIEHMTKLEMPKYSIYSLADELIDKFVSAGYLDDGEYARTYIDSHPYSARKLIAKLTEKGIKQEKYKEYLDEQREDETDLIRAELARMRDKDSDKKIAALMRKGYRCNDIKKVIYESDNWR